MPTTELHVVVNSSQESVRKDVERPFGVLTQHFHIALHPGCYRPVKMQSLTVKAICVLHNISVESRRKELLSSLRRAVGPDEGGRAGDLGGRSVRSGSAK